MTDRNARESESVSENASDSKRQRRCSLAYRVLMPLRRHPYKGAVALMSLLGTGFLGVHLCSVHYAPQLDFDAITSIILQIAWLGVLLTVFAVVLPLCPGLLSSCIGFAHAKAWQEGYSDRYLVNRILAFVAPAYIASSVLGVATLLHGTDQSNWFWVVPVLLAVVPFLVASFMKLQTLLRGLKLIGALFLILCLGLGVAIFWAGDLATTYSVWAVICAVGGAIALTTAFEVHKAIDRGYLPSNGNANDPDTHSGDAVLEGIGGVFVWTLNIPVWLAVLLPSLYSIPEDNAIALVCLIPVMAAFVNSFMFVSSMSRDKSRFWSAFAVASLMMIGATPIAAISGATVRALGLGHIDGFDAMVSPEQCAYLSSLDASFCKQVGGNAQVASGYLLSRVGGSYWMAFGTGSAQACHYVQVEPAKPTLWAFHVFPKKDRERSKSSECDFVKRDALERERGEEANQSKKNHSAQ